MNDLGLYISLGGLVIVVLIWMCWRTIIWVMLLRRGVIVEGRIESHQSIKVRRKFGNVTYFSLAYRYDCNETNYVRVEEVDTYTYKELKDGDRVKIRCLPEDPQTAQLEAPAYLTLLRRYSGWYKGSRIKGTGLAE